MTDFLTGLVERSVGPVEGIRPRLTSLFEPDRGAAGSAIETIAPFEAEPVEQETVALPSRARPARSPAITADAEERETRTRHVAIRPSASVSVPQRHDEGRLPLPTASNAASPPAAALPTGLIDGRDGDVREEVPRPRRLAPALAPVVALPGGIDEPSSGSDLLVASASARAEDRGLVVPPRPGAAVATDMQRAVAALDADRSRRPERAHDRPAVLDARSAPDVHVTIGRIDVRAVVEGKAAPRQRPLSPVMGLDEYLRVQAGRGGQ